MTRKGIAALTLGLASAILFWTVPASSQNAEPPGNERYRPQLHFSPRKNWTNDPNGLIFFEDEYHLFFQYNPFGEKWGHMSWGHAVSRDLLHWQQLPVALPESNGVMIFTGSTVLDTQNTSGFCSGGKPCLVAIYTGHTPEAPGKKALQTQNLAYSNDRGRTWTKYKGNPVLDRHMSDFRDPKVFWSDASKRWVLAVALPDDHKVLLYHSKDLKNWTQVSEFGPAGATGGQWECPELFQTPVEGKSGESRWVMKVGLNPGGLQGGSGEQYFVGDFDGKTFKNSNKPGVTLWTDYGKDCYCALTFNNLPKSRTEPVVIGWMDNWQYAADLPTAPPFHGQMTVPREMTLRQTAAGLRLTQRPIAAIEKLRIHPNLISGNESAVNEVLDRPDRALPQTSDILLNVQMGNARTFTLGIDRLEIGYDKEKETFFVDRSNAGKTDFNSKFPARTEAPLKLTGGNLELRLIVDRNSVEVFANKGDVTMTNLYFPAAQRQYLSLKSTGGELGPVQISFWELKP